MYVDCCIHTLIDTPPHLVFPNFSFKLLSITALLYQTLALSLAIEKKAHFSPNDFQHYALALYGCQKTVSRSFKLKVNNGLMIVIIILIKEKNERGLVCRVSPPSPSCAL